MSATVLTIDTAPETEPISAAEAKRHLRILSPDIEDSEVLDCVAAAREWAESFTARTLRATTSRVQAFDSWPCSPVRLEYPPLIGVTSVDYYDAADVDTELASANYRVHVSGESFGYLAWTATATLPGLATREDAVRITYTSGYAGGLIPAKAKQAILLMTGVLWGDMSGRELEYAEKAAISCLHACDWGRYA